MKSAFEAGTIANDPVAALPYDLGDDVVVALSDSLAVHLPALFVDYVTWAQSMLIHRRVSPQPLERALAAIAVAPENYVSHKHAELARLTIASASEALGVLRLYDEPAIENDAPHATTARRYLDALLDGNERLASREILLALAGGAKVLDIYDGILAPALRETGRLWQRNDIGVAEEHAVTAATERIMAQLVDIAQPRAHRDLSVVTAALGTSQHQIGARMVADAFALCGWNASYLGGNIPAEELLDYVDRVSVDVVAFSATVARDVVPIHQVIEALETRPIAPLVIVGGRIFSAYPSLWKHVGADGFAATPLNAVALASEMVCHSDST